MPVLDECSETSLSWLQRGTVHRVMGDEGRTGCLKTWSRRVYEFQCPKWHYVRCQVSSLRGSVVARHAGDDEGELSVHAPEEEVEGRGCSW